MKVAGSFPMSIEERLRWLSERQQTEWPVDDFHRATESFTFQLPIPLLPDIPIGVSWASRRLAAGKPVMLTRDLRVLDKQSWTCHQRQESTRLTSASELSNCLDVHPEGPPTGVFRVEMKAGTADVDPDRYRAAQYLDEDANFLVSREELAGSHEATSAMRVDPDEWIDYQTSRLLKQVPECASAYRGLQAIENEMAELERLHPGRARRVCIGRSVENRPIWALRIGGPADPDAACAKPGVVITALLHAREWVTGEGVMDLAHRLLEDVDQSRVESADIWLVPVTNPDGYEYSLHHDPAWRKNRSPLGGVDLNRNYPESYRLAGDSPDRTYDDKGASDDPKSDTYRGPGPASEPEIVAQTTFLAAHPNIRGVLDLHSCGEMILHPPGTSAAPGPQEEIYGRLGGRIQAALGDSYRTMLCSEFTTATGTANDYHDKHGILGMTLEMGRAFHPSAARLPSVKEQAVQASLAFIDGILREFA
ncbi:MAG: succinylglutamate desuccinylase/aspartoacylase family protein [Armatimonadetes bacterium]|nr:succinylglutamate desuccinylase/aspartoacylase family protein [Armatimonadota bacterium]